MRKKRSVGLIKRMWSEVIPFVAQDPEMKLDWLVGVIKKKQLATTEITPYMKLLVLDYNDAMTSTRPGNKTGADFVDLFKNIDREVMEAMLKSTDLRDIPALLEFIPDLFLADVVVILTKKPQPYEKKAEILIDRVFHAVYGRSSAKMLEDAAEDIRRRKISAVHFESSYKRFKNIKEDEDILSTMYPRAR